MLKVQANKKQYDALYISKCTSKETVGNFVGNHDAVSCKLHGIGFTADNTLILHFDKKSIALNPGTVLLRSKENCFGYMDQGTFEMLFNTIEQVKE